MTNTFTTKRRHHFNTSLYIIFVVLFPDRSISLFGLARMRVVFLDTPLDRATYSWPWENTGFRRYIPTCGIVCPYTLLIVIVKLSCTGNFSLLNLKGRERSLDGDKGILGIKTLF